MPRQLTQKQRQLRNPRSGASKQQGMSATQFMLVVTIAAVLFVVVNVLHLMPSAGFDQPLAQGQSLLNQPADSTPERKAEISTSSEKKSLQDSPSIPRGEDTQYHVIFSSGCSPKQSFQSYIFFFHALKSQQPGKVTRIAACKDENEANALRAHHKEFIEPMSPNFLLHITPDFSGVKEGHSFHYFNKPFSCHHWMENAMGYNPQHKQIGDNENDNTIIILCDPDQVIMRPFKGNQFQDASSKAWMKRTTHPIIDYVDHGKPMGQLYGFFDQWKTKTNITRYVPKDELPSFVQTMSIDEMRENYAVGPPYIATAHDFYTIVTRWKDFVPLVHDDYPHLLAEMFAYCLAAAHSRLPHQVARGFMVSDVSSFDLEGWHYIDKYSARDMCTPGAIATEDLPQILHYCQRYLLGKFVIGKHRIPLSFLSCDDPLLMEPPIDIGEKFNFYIEPDQREDQKKNTPEPTIKHHAFMLCHLIPYLNEAAIYWKDHHCDGKTPNKAKTLTFFKDMEVAPHFFNE